MMRDGAAASARGPSRAAGVPPTARRWDAQRRLAQGECTRAHGKVSRATEREREFTMTTTVTRRDLSAWRPGRARCGRRQYRFAGCGQPKTVAEAAAEKGLADTGRRCRPRVPRAGRSPITDFLRRDLTEHDVAGRRRRVACPLHTALRPARACFACRTSTPPTTGNMAASIDLTQTIAPPSSLRELHQLKSDLPPNRDRGTSVP